MKVILKNHILDSVSFKTKLGYSYELTPWNKLVLDKESCADDYIVPNNENDVMAFLKSLDDYVYEWIKQINMASKVKSSTQQSFKASPTLTLSPYQSKALYICLTLDRACLFMEQGTGKTPVALTLINIRKELATLIVCPKAVRQEWAYMINQFFPSLHYEFITNNDDFTAEKNTIYITNYERARLMNAHGFDMIFIDECHRIKDPSSENNKTLYRLQKDARYVYGLTGTPYSNSLIDIFGIAKVVDERYFGVYKGTFQRQYCVMESHLNRSTGEEYNVISGYKNMPEFKNKIDCFSYRVLKKDCLDLKEPIETRLWVERCKEYDNFKNNYLLEVKNSTAILNNVLNLTFTLQQICSGFIHTDDDVWVHLNTNKLDTLTEWINDNITSEQVIIYTTYNESEKMIAERLNKLNLKVAILSGNVKDAEKEIIKQKFKNNEVQFLIIKYKSGTEGLNFQNCYKMVFYDLTPSYIDYEQARSRIHRRGQNNECEYIHLITEDSVEIKVLQALSKRQDFSKYILERNLKYDDLL